MPGGGPAAGGGGGPLPSGITLGPPPDDVGGPCPSILRLVACIEVSRRDAVRLLYRSLHGMEGPFFLRGCSTDYR